MASGRTARRALDYPLTTDAYKIAGDIQALATQLDNDAETGQGTLSARPVASTRGRVYYVTGDAEAKNNGILWWDSGSVWVAVGGTGEWQSFLSLGEHIEGSTAQLQEPKVRLEQGGTVVRMRGGLKPLEARPAESVIATLPPGYKLSSTRQLRFPCALGNLGSLTLGFVEVASANVISVTALAVNQTVCLDGIDFNTA